MQRSIVVLLFTSLLCGSAARARADTEADQLAGGIEAVVFACTPVDAKSAKVGAELLQKTVAKRKIDLPAARQTEAYRSVYNGEVNRLLSLPIKERIAACRTAW